MVTAASKKHVAKTVEVHCVKCRALGSAFERSIWKCPSCGQANAVLAPGGTVRPKTIEEQKAKRKFRPRKEEFRRDCQMMLYGEQGS